MTERKKTGISMEVDDKTYGHSLTVQVCLVRRTKS